MTGNLEGGFFFGCKDTSLKEEGTEQVEDFKEVERKKAEKGGVGK